MRPTTPPKFAPDLRTEEDHRRPTLRLKRSEIQVLLQAAEAAASRGER